MRLNASSRVTITMLTPFKGRERYIKIVKMKYSQAIVQPMQVTSKIGLIFGIILIMVLILVTATADNLTAEDYYNQGIDYAKLQQYTDAVASYDKAIQINPDYSNAWYNRGNALLNLGKYDDAVASYDKVVKIDPQYSDAWVNRGVTLGKLGRYDDAIASYDKAIQINPNDADAWYNRGNAFLYLDRYDDAVASYDKAIQINPQYADAQQNREVALNQKSGNTTATPVQKSQQPTPTMTLPPLNQQPTIKVPLVYAPFGAIAIMVALSGLRKRR